MKYLSVVALIANASASQIGSSDVVYNYGTYGPYFKEVDRVGQRALGRPSDSNFAPSLYGDSAGQHTGTLYQRLAQEDPNKEREHTDRTYGPYFDDAPRDGH